MTKQSYFWATPSGPIRLIEGDKMPVKPEMPGNLCRVTCGQWLCQCHLYADQCQEYEAALQAAKESSVPIQDQFQARLLIYIKNNSEDIKPDTIYGPLTVEYRIESRCCANPNLAIGACDRDCDAYESFTKTKGPSKVAILYDDTPEKEPQEDHSKISKLKSALQDKIRQFEAYKTDPRYQTEMEQNAVAVTLRELKYLDSIAEYE